MNNAISKKLLTYVQQKYMLNPNNTINSNIMCSVKDLKHNFLFASEGYLKLFNLWSINELIGNPISALQMLPVHNINIIHQQEKQVIDSGQSARGVMCLEVGEVSHIYAVTIIPIKYKSKVIGIEKKMSFIAKYHFKYYMDLYKIKERVPVVTLTEYEMDILALLILNKTQQETAHIMGFSRSKIVRVLTNLCSRLNISGCATKYLIAYTIASGLYLKLPPEIILLFS